MMHPTIQALRPYLNAWGIDHQDEVLAAVPSMDLMPRLMDLQARVQTLEHALQMDQLTFELIVEHPDQAAQLSGEALKRIGRVA